ncbi:MAG: Na+/H+ antiporter subunit E [Thermomicrobiales bacterium]
MRRALVWIPALAVIYALTLASFDPWDLAIGAVLGAGVMAVFWRFPLTEAAGGRRQAASDANSSAVRRPPSAVLWFWPFVAVMVWEVVKGTWQVALVVLGRRPSDRAGFIAIPIGERTPLGVAVFGIATTLSPGSVLVDVDWSEGTMLYHVLDASDPDAIRAQFAWLYERWQRRVVP